MTRANAKQQERFLSVNWGEGYQDMYKVEIVIKAFNRPHLLQDVTNLLANESAQIISFKTDADPKDNQVRMQVVIEIDGMASLSRLLNRLELVPNIFEARRIV